MKNIIHYSAKVEDLPIIIHGSYSVNLTVEEIIEYKEKAIAKAKSELSKKMQNHFKIDPKKLIEVDIYFHKNTYDPVTIQPNSEELTLLKWKKT